LRLDVTVPSLVRSKGRRSAGIIWQSIGGAIECCADQLDDLSLWLIRQSPPENSAQVAS
jgi:hypothetical protein